MALITLALQMTLNEGFGNMILVLTQELTPIESVR